MTDFDRTLSPSNSPRRVMTVLFVAIFVAMVGMGIIAPVMPLYAETLGASGFSLGLIYSMFSVSRALFMPMTGKLSDRHGRKIFISWGLFIYALVSLGYLWSHSVMHLIWVRFLHGVGSAMAVTVAAAMIGDISPKGKEGRMMGFFNFAMFLGFGAGPLLGGLVNDAFGFSAIFLLMGGLSLVSLLVVVFFLDGMESARKTKTYAATPFFTMWKEDKIKSLLTFRFSNAVGRGAIIAFIPVFADRLGFTPAQTGVIISLNIFTTAILQNVFGNMSDRLNRPFLMVLGNTLGALPMMLTPFVHRFSHLVVLGMITGAGSGLAFPAAGALTTEEGRHHGMGNMMGYFNMAMSVGMIVGPVAAGWVMDYLGLSMTFVFGGLVGLLGSGACLYWLFIKKGVRFHAHV